MVCVSEHGVYSESRLCTRDRDHADHVRPWQPRTVACGLLARKTARAVCSAPQSGQTHVSRITFHVLRPAPCSKSTRPRLPTRVHMHTDSILNMDNQCYSTPACRFYKSRAPHWSPLTRPHPLHALGTSVPDCIACGGHRTSTPGTTPRPVVEFAQTPERCSTGVLFHANNRSSRTTSKAKPRRSPTDLHRAR